MTEAMVVSAALSADEAVIERGLTSFVDVGLALSRIRDRGDYVDAGYATFEAYCRERWGMGRTFAHYQIEAANVVHNCERAGLKPPANEGQARPLTRLPPEKQADAWREAIAAAPEGRVTARIVEAVVSSLAPKGTPMPSSGPLASVRSAIARLSHADRQALLWSEGLVDAKHLDTLAGSRLRDSRYVAARAALDDWDEPGADAIRFALDGGEIACAVLGVSTDTCASDVKRAFRAASVVSHPDKGGAAAVFSLISAASLLLQKLLSMH